MSRGKKGISDALRVRHIVFTREQGIDPNIDKDGLDKLSIHLERFAVLKSYRGQGVGKLITEYAINYCRKKGLKEICLKL